MKTSTYLNFNYVMVTYRNDFDKDDGFSYYSLDWIKGTTEARKIIDDTKGKKIPTIFIKTKDRKLENAWEGYVSEVTEKVEKDNKTGEERIKFYFKFERGDKIEIEFSSDDVIYDAGWYITKKIQYIPFCLYDGKIKITWKDIKNSYEDNLNETTSEVMINGKYEFDYYMAKLIKYIPSEVIALYLTLDAIVRSTKEVNPLLYWFIFIFGVIVTPFYLWKINRIRKKLRLIIPTIAFFVWVFAMGGPFVHLDWYNSIYGGVLVPIYTFITYLIIKEEK